MGTRSAKRRTSELFLRNGIRTVGRYDFPIIKQQPLPKGRIDLVGYKQSQSESKKVDLTKCGIHFFQEDDIFAFLEKDPYKRVDRLKQYAFVLSPDFSIYPEMPIWRQMQSIAMSRYVGACWQKAGLTVIPTIAWGTDARCFEFCFDGIPQRATVAVSTVGCKDYKREFLYGYAKMRKALQPKTIICYGTPFREMEYDHIISIPYKLYQKGGK